MTVPCHGYNGWEGTSRILILDSEVARSVCENGGVLEDVYSTAVMSGCATAKVTRDQTFTKKCDILNNTILADP